MKDRRKELGQKGEDIAVLYLEEKGYCTLERNYRCYIGEIDIVAENKGEVIFIEVRSRSSQRFGLAEESITPLKQQRLRKIALYYLQAKNIPGKNVSFDVVAINFKDRGIPEIIHFQQAF